MKVTLVSMAYPHPRAGFWPGIERQVYDFAEALREAGAEVKVITSFRNGGEPREEHRGIRIYRVEDTSHKYGRLGYLMNRHISSFASNALQVEDAVGGSDVIQSFVPLPDDSVLQRDDLRLYAFFAHRDRASRWVDSLHLPWHYSMQKAFFSRVRGVIVASEESRRVLMEEYGVPGTKIEVVHLGVSPRFLEVVRRSSRDGSGRVEFLFVGPLIRRKGLRTLVDALPRVKEAGVPFRVTLAGHGPDRPELERRASRLGVRDLIEFAGYVPDEKLLELYSRSDLFVFPSLKEGFGLVLVEAMASGLPVVTSAVPPLTEIAEGAGVHFKPGDARDLSRVLGDLLRDPARREALGRVGKQRVRDRYLWSRAAQRSLEIFSRDIVKR